MAPHAKEAIHDVLTIRIAGPIGIPNRQLVVAEIVMTSSIPVSRGYSAKVRAAVQATRLLVLLSVMLVSGILVSIATTSLIGTSSLAFALGTVAGSLLCLCPEFWQLVVLRVDEDRDGPVRFIDLRPSFRSRTEFVPQWHPDSPHQKWR